MFSPYKPPAITTNTTTTFTSAATSQAWSPFGTPSTPQLFSFGPSGQTTSITQPIFNPPTSMASTNTAPSGTFGMPVFGTNQMASTTQAANIFGSNRTGTTVKFSPVSTQGTFPVASLASNPFVNNTTTVTNSFTIPTSNVFNTPNSLFNQPVSTASTTTTPWKPATSVASAVNIFGMPVTPVFNPFGSNPFTTAVSSSPAMTNTCITQPFTTQSPFQFTTKTSAPTPTPTMVTSVPAFSGFNPPAWTPSTTNIFSVPASTMATSVPAFSAFAPPASTSSTTSIFSNPAVTTVNTIPNAISGTQPTVPFFFPSNIFGTNSQPPTTTTTIVSILNPQLVQSFPVIQSQPVVTSSSSSTVLSHASTQEQNPAQSISNVQQQFLAASLLDPYANRGQKDFTHISPIQVPTKSTVASASSIQTITTSTPIPVILPLQSNYQKVSSSRSSIDVNFKLKPVSSSLPLTPSDDDTKSSHQRSTGATKSTLAGGFTDEEELVLLGRTKLSKLRLSNDLINPLSQTNNIRSLYPVRRLAELEKLTNITPPSSPATTSDSNKRTSPHHHSIPSVIPQQSLSRRIPCKSTLPILTRENYYMKPNLTELKSLFNDQGQCILKQFTVGHEKYGSVTFYGQINVTGLNLDEIIEINHHEVIVYPDDQNKPSVGEELNRPARITLLGVYPIDRATHEEITDVERIKAMNYTDHLCEVTKRFNGEFIKYEIDDGSWTFMVQHFTRYGLDETILKS